MDAFVDDGDERRVTCSAMNEQAEYCAQFMR